MFKSIHWLLRGDVFFFRVKGWFLQEVTAEATYKPLGYIWDLSGKYAEKQYGSCQGSLGLDQLEDSKMI